MIDPQPTTVPRLRSGTAARLAGLPVTTLRVWERRYGVVAAPKTATGQRLYSTLDVQRLGLMRQLTERGHAIGTLATLPLEDLRGLAAGVQHTALATRDVLLVGSSVAPRLRSSAACTLRKVYEDLDAAEADCADAAGATDGNPVDLLLVHLPSLQPAHLQRLPALRERLQAATLVVLYAFGAESLAETLRARGAEVLREPVSGRELLRRICAAAPAAAARGLPDVQGDVPSARRFSDDALATLAAQPSRVACECPRHLAEIVLQLASFERYSADCGARSPDDAALHRELGALTARARAQFEQALERVAEREGLSTN